MSVAVILALHLITLTTADGKSVEINPNQIVAFRPPRISDAFVAGAQCLVFTTDGKYLSVRNSCEEIRSILEQSQ